MSSKTKRIFSLIILAVFTITAAAGCKNKEEAPFTPRLSADSDASLVFYGNYSNFEALESEFDRFAEYYPNVSLSYTYLDGYYNDVIANSLLSKEAPDIYCTFSGCGTSPNQPASLRLPPIWAHRRPGSTFHA